MHDDTPAPRPPIPTLPSRAPLPPPATVPLYVAVPTPVPATPPARSAARVGVRIVAATMLVAVGFVLLVAAPGVGLLYWGLLVLIALLRALLR